MKKLSFAVQVFGLIIALPLYAVLELNHVSEPSTIAEKTFPVKVKPETMMLKILIETTADFNSQLLVVNEISDNHQNSKK